VVDLLVVAIQYGDPRPHELVVSMVLGGVEIVLASRKPLYRRPV
jgi:hypothetical protein